MRTRSTPRTTKCASARPFRFLKDGDKVKVHG